MDLSVIIPARNERFLKETVDSVLKNMRGDTEIIIIADGSYPVIPIPQHDRVQMVYHPVSVGQREATNHGAAISKAKYIMKLDAHCELDEGFDVKLMADCDYDWTVIPRMYNLHVFDWLCKDCGHRRYQGPTAPCDKCQSTNQEMSMVWQPRWNRQSDFMRFDSTLHFQYWGEYKKRPEAQGDICDLMSAIGACFFMHRDRFWELGGLDNNHGSWGQFGVEVACKAWLSGGRHVVNKKTWFAHLFRTQGGDFGFPYDLSGKQVERARRYSRDLWQNNKWALATRPFSWIIDHFKPIPDWHDKDGNLLAPVNRVSTAPAVSVPAPSGKVTDDAPVISPRSTTLTKGLIYYTDNRLDGTTLGDAVKAQLLRAGVGLPVTAAGLRDATWATRNVLVNGERGHLTMFKEILAALEASQEDIVFFTEHDVLYHPSHFEFLPRNPEVFYYNLNVWKVNSTTGHAIHYITKQLSGLCCYRTLALEHYRKRVRRVEEHGFTRAMGFEPGSHKRKERIDDRHSDAWWSTFPNVDVRHDKNLTQNRWRQDQFRDQRNCQGWQEAGDIPGWGRTEGRFDQWLSSFCF